MPLTRGMLVMLRIIIFWTGNRIQNLLSLEDFYSVYSATGAFCEILVDLVHKNTAIEKTATQYTL